MSASREKRSRQELSSSGQTNPKTVREAQQRREEKRSSILYGIIAAAFILVTVSVIVWKSNIIQRNATAAVIDGEKYTAAEVAFHYQNVYRSFLNRNYTYISYGLIGLNPNISPSAQTISADDAAMLGLEEEKSGQTWKDYFVDMALEQMSVVQSVLKAAQDEGFVYPDSVQTDYDDSMAALRSNAAASNLSVNQYLQSNMGGAMTEQVYGERLLASIRYEAYAQAKEDSLTYSDSDLESAYSADRSLYDRATYEAVTISGTAESTTDADGNTVEPTEAENAAAMAAAKSAAEEMLAAYLSGESLETLAESNDKATYSHPERTGYASNPLMDWVFDDARRTGDAQVVEGTSSYYVAVFQEKSRNDYNTIDVRHVLIRPAEVLTTDDGGAGTDGDAGMDAARQKAEELLAQWKAGPATEESFADLARENSEDGNASAGGLYEQVYQGQMVDTFNDWCFDSSRRPGDTGVVETAYGCHVMYFVGENLPYWKVQVSGDLKDQAMNEWYASFTEGHTIEANSSGIKYVG